jgi:hypothetical protein
VYFTFNLHRNASFSLQWLVDRVKYTLEWGCHLLCNISADASKDIYQEAKKVLTTVEGIYRDGRIELKSLPSNVAEEAKVIVTFIDSDTIDLAARGIDRSQAEALRNSLATFAEDWNSPEMSIYDNYDAAKSQL